MKILMTSLYKMIKEYIFESNHISALVESAVEVREVEGEESNDVRERSSLKQDYEDFFALYRRS